MLAIAGGSYLTVTALIVGLALRSTGGVLIYSLDDPYIHMAVARTLAQHGTYGIGPDAYESASSSPAWTLLLATIGYLASPRVFTLAPLLLSLSAGLWILWLFTTRNPMFARARPWLGGLGALLLPVALYLPGLAVTGMEHTLHAAVTLATMILLERIAEGRARGHDGVVYYTLLASAAVLRPEAIFFGLGCAVALLATRGVDSAACSMAASMLPVCVFGMFNRLHGQYFFPNSVVAKTLLEEGGVTPWAPRVTQFADAVRDDPMLTVLFLVILAYWIAVARMRPGRHAAPCMAFIVCTLLRVNYAALGWLDRYQGYLIIAGMFIVLAVCADNAAYRRRWVFPVAVAVLLAVLPWGKFRLMLRAPFTIGNVYRAQYQLARFLAQYYPGRPVAVNDLGLIALLHGTPLRH